MARNCTSLHRCKRCQKLIILCCTLMLNLLTNSQPPRILQRSSNLSQPALYLLMLDRLDRAHNYTLLMTWQVLIHAPNGSQIRARGLLDTGSSISFVSQRLVQSQISSKNLEITGIAGISHNSPLHSFSTFYISPTDSPN